MQKQYDLLTICKKSFKKCVIYDEIDILRFLKYMLLTFYDDEPNFK